MKKLLSVLLITVMMLSVVSTAVFAALPTPVTYTDITPVSTSTSTYSVTQDSDGLWNVAHIAGVTTETNLYPDFRFDLNGTTETKRYDAQSTGYLMTSYALDLIKGDGTVYVRPSNISTSTNTFNTALTKGQHQIVYIYDLANAKCYMFIDGADPLEGTYATAVEKVDNVATNYYRHRVMISFGKTTYEAGVTAYTVTTPVTEEYDATADLDELKAAAKLKSIPDPGSSAKVELTPTVYASGTTKVNNGVATINHGEDSYGAFQYKFDNSNEIKFDQSEEIYPIKYLHFHTTLKSDKKTEKVQVRTTSGSSALKVAPAFQFKNINTEYDFDILVDLENKTFDFYVNGAPLQTGAAYTSDTLTAVGRVQFLVHNTVGEDVNITISDSYLIKYYGHKPLYTTFDALRATVKTNDVYLDNPTITYDCEGKKYLLEAQMFGVDNNSQYNIIAGYDSEDRLVFAKRYAPNFSENVEITDVNEADYIKAFSWVNGTLKPLMSPVDVTIK